MARAGAFAQETKAAALLRAGYRCEACGANPVSEYHHRQSRQMGGSRADWISAVSNCMALCGDCHLWITTHPRQAAIYGWSVRRGVERPAAVPVFIKSPRGGRSWVTFTWDGRYAPVSRPDPLEVVR